MAELAVLHAGHAYGANGKTSPHAYAQQQLVNVDRLLPLPKEVGDKIVTILPGQPSVFWEEAALMVQTRLDQWGLRSLDSFNRLAIAMAANHFPSSVTAERLAAVTAHVVFLWFLDDLCFDVDDIGVSRAEAGIPSAVLRHSAAVPAFLRRAQAVFTGADPPPGPGRAFERAYWDVAQEMRRLSLASEFGAAWFDPFAFAAGDCFDASLDIRADLEGEARAQRDMEAFYRLRLRNSGYEMICLQVELVRNAVLPAEVRAHPSIQKLNRSANLVGSLTNDLFSYHLDVLEGNQISVMKLLMAAGDGVPLEKARERAVELINSHTRDFLDMEASLPVWEPAGVDELVRSYVLGLKEMMAGTINFHRTASRYNTWPGDLK